MGKSPIPRHTVTLGAVLFALLIPFSVHAYELQKLVFPGAAVETSGGSYSLLATAGDPIAGGETGGGSFSLAQGFWSGYSETAIVDVGPPPLEATFANHLQFAMPNPFTNRTALSYSVASPSPVRLAIYGVDGRLVRTLVSGFQEPGRYRVEWDGRDELGRNAATSIYFYRLEVGNWSDTKKLTKLH